LGNVSALGTSLRAVCTDHPLACPSISLDLTGDKICFSDGTESDGLPTFPLYWTSVWGRAETPEKEIERERERHNTKQSHQHTSTHTRLDSHYLGVQATVVQSYQASKYLLISTGSTRPIPPDKVYTVPTPTDKGYQRQFAC
jgi:hypothetical protein